LTIAQVPQSASDASLQCRWIGSVGQHDIIMVAFEKKGITGAQHPDDMRGIGPGISEYAQPLFITREDKLGRFPGIVRHRERRYLDISYVKATLMGAKELDVRQFPTTILAMGSWRHPDRNLVTARHGSNTPDMILVLMGNDNGFDGVGIHTYLGQPSLHLTRREPTIQQDPSAFNLDERGISTAATA